MTLNYFKKIIVPFLFFILTISPTLVFAQNSQANNCTEIQTQLQSSLYVSKYLIKETRSGSINNSLAFKQDYNKKWGLVNLPPELLNDDFKPWESEKHFGTAVWELAVVELIPWVLARYIRHWEDPSDNWAIVGFQSWWRNINNGWEYDGDNFTTNNFAHPYHGGLFFNVGRTNGYDFWESTAWSLTGSAMWEYFGETFRPAFNDWIYTGVGGINLGEITYRLSSMVTDNTASGSDRMWSEIFGTLINPVRGFNRAITGEMGQNFPNPEWSRPDDFLITFDAGTRTIDKNGDKQYRDKELEGLFRLSLTYGNPFKAKKPFEYFGLNLAIASGLPHFTQVNSDGFLFGYELEKNKHRFDVNLDFNYNNLIKEEISEGDTSYKGFLFGTTQLYPHILSRFPIGKKIALVTQIGINTILMGATPNDYYVDVEGRVYDFGPGIGTRLYASIQDGIWSYFNLLYYGAWLWTQSEPSDSKHHIHFLILEGQYPFTSYFSVGVSAGIYWRNSYYENFPDVSKNHPIIRVFFKTAIVDL